MLQISIKINTKVGEMKEEENSKGVYVGACELG